MYPNTEVRIMDRRRKVEEIITYDSECRITRHYVKKRNIEYRHSYDERGRISRTTTSKGEIRRYTYREGTDYIESRVIYNEDRCPQHKIIEYVKGDNDKIYQYVDDELEVIREYSSDDEYSICHMYSGEGRLMAIKHKYIGTDNLRYHADFTKGTCLKYQYNDSGNVTKIIDVKTKKRIHRYNYNDDGTIDVIIDYKYDKSGRFIKCIENQHNYKNGRLSTITIDGNIITYYEYSDLSK